VTIAEAVARPLLAGMFIYGGIDALRNPGPKSETATAVLDPLQDATGLEGPALVKVNAGVQVAAGACLALGILPRPAAALLAVSLVPTTLGGHRPWEHEDPKARSMQTIQVLKNVAMLGGLLLAATSTGGRPSLPWRAKRAAHQLAVTSADTLDHLRHAG
jgi:putative oxidoreductase